MVPEQPLDGLLQLACSMFNVSAALLVLCGDRCIRIVRAHCVEGEFKVSWQQRQQQQQRGRKVSVCKFQFVSAMTGPV
jgi:hypothetical protein